MTRLTSGLNVTLNAPAPKEITPESLFSSYSYLAVLHAKRLKEKFRPFSYGFDDLVQEGLIALWKAVNKPQVINTDRPNTLKGFFSVCIYRAINHLKQHKPHVSYHSIGGLV